MRKLSPVTIRRGIAYVRGTQIELGALVNRFMRGSSVDDLSSYYEMDYDVVEDCIRYAMRRWKRGGRG